MSGADARALAERLAGMSDAQLSSLLAARRVPMQVGWRDFFDAAEALLSPESVSTALRALPRDVLAGLASGRPVRGDGVVSSLVDAEGRRLSAVAAALAGARFESAPHEEPAHADDTATAHAAERAFTSLAALADVLIGALKTPLSRVGGGAVGASDRRRLVQEEIVRDAAELDDLVALGETAGLLYAVERSWLVTDAGREWIRRPTRSRWTLLVRGWRNALPAGVRTPEGGWIAPSSWPVAYPLDPAWPDRATLWGRLAVLSGLLTPEGAEPPWAAPARRGGEPDAEGLAAFLPGEVDRVFLQNDLTAISPGPLAPELDVRLRTMTSRESHAQASTYRFTETTLSSAISAGETAEGIRSFLSGLSLTGIPQPLDYLLSRADERHGLVRVSIEPESGHTIVSSRDHQLIETIGVDQALRALGLVFEGALLRTKASRDAVYWALADARYPVVALDSAGDALSLHRQRLAAEGAERDPAARYAPLVARLRGAHGNDSEAAWRERELDSAVRAKALIVVEVAMPDGSTRELTLEASGLGGGRLRGRDRAADVERTLPVALIRSVRPA
ncbi:helicase-associated domain-containing protein [Microbacterium betulae]|uniref:Helicase-associated domain-containing protein n=1 Tax=Microbacterium betulae TaxID=2981139 RepID=A0AA97FJG7_9MICO|nr:helicase-associated domain-containing protein [Microbacterium sp. AB]WOF23883.1 helicase-associated domain-containing protein [Microbacterium sp. AB]